jgi:hypothetical protein
VSVAAASVMGTGPGKPLLRDRLTVSLGSTRVSLMTGTAKVSDVTPGPKVRVPETGVKSATALAVPAAAA